MIKYQSLYPLRINLLNPITISVDEVLTLLRRKIMLVTPRI